MITVLMVALFLAVFLGAYLLINAWEADLESELVNAGSLESRQDYFSEGERAFFRRLREAVGHDVEVFPRVRRLDLPMVVGREEMARGKAEIYTDRVDFLLFSRGSYVPLAVVELGGRAPGNDGGPEAEERFDSGLLGPDGESLRLPIVSVEPRKDWDPADLRGFLARRLFKHGVLLLARDPAGQGETADAAPFSRERLEPLESLTADAV